MLISLITPTHDARWIPQLWESIKAQRGPDWEWVVAVNHKTGRRQALDGLASDVEAATGRDPRVRIVKDERPFSGVGSAKRHAFMQGKGDVLMEVDHDDLLLPGAIEECAVTMLDPEIGFCYSDFCDFGEPGPVTYQIPEVRRQWDANGFVFYDADLPGLGKRECVASFEPSAQAVSLVFYAPNHFRAWRRSAYEAAGGHRPDLALCDDHELVCRTYLTTKMARVPLPLYAYRIAGQNTWAKNQAEIRRLTLEIRSQYLEHLILREAQLRRLPCFDLGSAISPRPGWLTVDVPGVPDADGCEARLDVAHDLSQAPWPWPDSSVGAFRASDLLEHLPDKQQTMREIWRCLAPGGWLLSLTPSTDGRGAFSDPTHVSYWNQDSFPYWTRAQKARYVRHREPPMNRHVRFMEVELRTDSFGGDTPYVVANLIALKEGMPRLPGEIMI